MGRYGACYLRRPESDMSSGDGLSPDRSPHNMELNKLVFAGVALGCLAAAAAGGYLAAGPGPDNSAAFAVSEPAAGTPTATPVAESEGVIAPEATSPAAPSTPLVVEPSPVAPRRESAPRPSRTTPAPERRAQPTIDSNSRSARRDTPARTPAESSPARSAPTTSSGSMWETRPAVEPERAPLSVEPEAPSAPAAPEMVDLVVPADAVLGLQIDRTITSDVARVEDRVEARVTRDVRVGDRVAIPAGSVVQGSVMEVERGGKIKERARLGIRFHTVVLDDGSRLNIWTDAVVRDGASPAQESAAKFGGAAVGGAILGAILGGGKGAVIGGSVGAAGGTAATMAGGRNAAVLPAGTTVSVRVQQPVTVTVEK